MKRKGQLIEKIAETENILLAIHKAFRGKSDTAAVLSFRRSIFEHVHELQNQLQSGKVDVGRYHKFIIYEPKKRVICAAPLAQRVLHHALMNVCHDVFDRQLISDCYASRPGKGTHAAIKRVQSKMGSYKYFAKLDVRKFFDSIDHEVLRSHLMRIFKDKKLLDIFSQIIGSYGEGKGVPIGNLTSQYFANYYLSPLDHYMKEVQRADFYVRYMDDVIMLGNDKSKVRDWISSYQAYAETTLKLQIKPPVIGRTCHGIPFLGYKVYSGRILMNGKGKRRFRKHLKLLNSLYNESRISEQEYADRLLSVMAYAEFADSRRFREKLLG